MRPPPTQDLDHTLPRRRQIRNKTPEEEVLRFRSPTGGDVAPDDHGPNLVQLQNFALTVITAVLGAPA
jgi:hypothetical protein